MPNTVVVVHEARTLECRDTVDDINLNPALPIIGNIA